MFFVTDLQTEEVSSRWGHAQITRHDVNVDGSTKMFEKVLVVKGS